MQEVSLQNTVKLSLLALLKRMIYTWINKNSFVPQDEERCIYKLQKGELTMTKLTLEEKQELIRMALAARAVSYTHLTLPTT